MKQKNKAQEMKKREEKIIEFVKNHPYCSKDSIFTKGNIPKSKATTELFNNLVLQKKILASGVNKKRYFVEFPDEIKKLEFIFSELVDRVKNIHKYNDGLIQKFSEFLWTRFRVLNYEARHSKELGDLETLKMIIIFMFIAEKRTKLGDAFLLDTLDWAINDDRYYLKHHIHASPEKIRPVYYKSTEVSRRRGIIDLFDMKNKGKESRHKHGLKSNSAYNNLMRNLGDDPVSWINRVFVEKGRTLYPDPSKLTKKIYKKILTSTRLKNDDPRYEIKKMVLDSEKKTFPNVSTYDVSEIFPELISFLKQIEQNDQDEGRTTKFLEDFILNVLKNGLEENHMRRTVKFLTRNTV